MDKAKDTSQAVKADGATAEVKPQAETTQQPATQAGPKASDIPADSIVPSGQAGSTRNEYSLNQQDLVRVRRTWCGCCALTSDWTSRPASTS